MKKVVVTGRVIPERVLAQFQTVEFRFDTSGCKGSGKVCCQMSLVSCVLEFDEDIENHALIGEIFKEVASNLSNIISFHITASYHLALDLIVDLETGDNHPIPVSEPVFPVDRPDFSFSPSDEHAAIKIYPTHLGNRQLQEALNELSLAMNRPHVTQMHCRRALEAVRAFFEPQDQPDGKEREKAGWQIMRETLKIKRDDIESFRELALAQRHGRVTPNSWEERKAALALTIETVHRLMRYLLEETH